MNAAPPSPPPPTSTADPSGAADATASSAQAATATGQPSRRHDRGLSTRMAIVLALANLVFIVLAGLSLLGSYRASHLHGEVTTRNLVQLLASDLDGEISKADLALAALKYEFERQLSAGRVDPVIINRLAIDLRLQLPYLDAIRLTDAEGILRYGTDVNPAAGISLADRPHFITLRQERTAGLVRSKVQTSRANNRPVLVFARRMETPGGDFAGMVFAALSLDYFNAKFAAVNVGPRGAISLLDEDYDIVARYPRLPNGQTAFSAADVSAEFKSLAAQGRTSGIYVARFAPDGIERTSAFQKVFTGLYLRTGLATDDFLEPWKRERTRTLTVLVGLSLASILAAVIFHRHWKQRLIASEVLHQSQHPMTLIDAGRRFTYVNPAFSRLFGYTLDEIRGQPVGLIAPTIGQSTTMPGETIAHSDRTGHFRGRVLRRAKDGREISVLLNIAPVMDTHGGTLCYVADMTDMTEIERHESALAHSSQHDTLTGLPNRVLLRDRMQQALAQAERRKTLLAVCYLDLDGFKPVNDAHGYKTGDRLLVETAVRLQTAVRSGDTVARLGGDEFVLLLPDVHDVAELEQVLARIQAEIGRPCVIDGNDFTLAASIGVSLYPLDNSDTDLLLRHADKAMYAAKQAGKNRYSFFDTSEEHRLRLEQEMSARVRAGLEQGEFRLHYQPKVDMRSGMVVGVEALVRWQDAERGLLMPGTFLPFIENSEAIVELGDWVLNESMRQMQVWQDAGTRLDVSVNIAGIQLARSDFLAKLAALLTRYPDIAPGRLELEILESTALDDIGLVSRVIAEGNALGVHFALDDFGTGYSSLTYLRRLPSRTLKIDQSFVREMLIDPEDLAITEGVVGLARAFQRTPVAEGVETVRHGTLLLRLGCDQAQGYGISRPIPPEAIPAWLHDYRPEPEWLEAANTPWSREYFPLLHMEVEHRRWVDDVVKAVENDDPARLPRRLKDHHDCNFGRWLAGDGYIHFRHLPEFRRIGPPHREVHEVGHRVAVLLSEGRAVAARRLLIELTARRDEVLDALELLRRAIAAAEKLA